MKDILQILNNTKPKTKYEINDFTNIKIHPEFDKIFGNKIIISFKMKKEYVDNKFKNKMESINKPINLKFYNNSCGIYYIDNSNIALYITYGIDSHIQVPKLLLNHFKTGDYLYFTNSETRELHRNSAKNYNTQFGYYTMNFENFLNSNYEKILSNLINKIKPFAEKRREEIIIDNLYEDVEKILKMALIRNINFIKDVNSKIQSPIELDSEVLSLLVHNIRLKFLKNMKIMILINDTDSGIILLKSMIASYKNSIIIPLHPKFAILLLPNDVYKSISLEYGEADFIVIEDTANLINLNKIIYYYAMNQKDDVIGIKSDLEILLNDIKNERED